MISPLVNENEIIRRCQKGDVSAFEEIYHHFERSLYLYALRMLGNDEDARDVVQITFIKLFRSIKRFSFKSRFGSYLFRILINSCYDLIKTRKKEAPGFSNKFEYAQDSDQGLKTQLEEAISSLPLRMRECFVLFAVEGFRQNEIAEILSISEGTVKAHIFKAKQKLKRLLADIWQEKVQ